MKKRVEVSIKMLQVRIYGEHPDAYESVFDIYVDGVKGFIFSLIGKGFYSSVDDVVDALGKFGIKEFHGSVMPTHSAAIQRLMGKKYDVSFPESTECAGRVMYWAKVKRKDLA
jgi:hypothetical protein